MATGISRAALFFRPGPRQQPIGDPIQFPLGCRSANPANSANTANTAVFQQGAAPWHNSTNF